MRVNVWLEKAALKEHFSLFGFLSVWVATQSFVEHRKQP